MRLVWNAIVRNESARIARCVDSLLPHVDGAVIVDTGSTDGTQEVIRQAFEAAGKHVTIQQAPFEDFSQARNVALRALRESSVAWDYALLCDADMELVVDDPSWTSKLNGGPAYDVKQVAGSMVYWNRRLMHWSATGNYLCPTHEYLDVPTAGTVDGLWFRDHADGANRPGKFKRDIELLERALQDEQNPGLRQRMTFYLAQSYRDAGQYGLAAALYRERVDLGGFDEEVWFAQFHYANCLNRVGNEAGFVREMLRAYELRPTRMESLHALAKHYREQGANHASLLFSSVGLRAPSPSRDVLFVDDYVHHTGLKEEFAICAYYDPLLRDQGAQACNAVALSPVASEFSRAQARANLYWYLKPLVQHVPSFKPTRIDLAVPEGYVATNPSVVNRDGRPTAIVRAVNYTITPEGQYAIRSVDGSTGRNYPIHTHNYLVNFSRSLTIEQSHELALPSNWPEPKFDMVRGFEDSRLFDWGGQLWTLSCVRELTREGWCEQVLAPVSTAGYGNTWVTVQPEQRRHEKNWMPWVRDKGRLLFVYRLGQLMDVGGKLRADFKCDLAVDHVSGGSQVIEVEGQYIALVHEAGMVPGRPNRFYQHRFVLLGEAGDLLGISPPFCFHGQQIEFAAGLAYFPVTRKLLASYGVRDSEAWLAEMDLYEVLDFIEQGCR